MSLLVKALEKAAQDREGRGQQDIAQPLGLEPILTKATTAPTGAVSATADSETRVGRDTGTMRSPVDFARGAASQLATSRAAAATVIQAQRPAGVSGVASRAPTADGVVAWLRARPVYAFGALAGAFLACYGAYVYVQIFHPGLLQRAPVRANPAVVAMQSSPTPTASTATPTSPLGDRPIPDVVTRNNSDTRDGGNDKAGDDAPTQATPPAMMGSVSVPVVRDVPSATQPRMQLPMTPSSAAPVVNTASTPSAQFASPPARIAVNRADVQPRVNPLVGDAYAALERGQLETAQRLYAQAARTEPNNVDALMGLAAIAQAENRLDDAQRHFMAILEVDPRNALAQSGLINQSARGDPAVAETRLKQLISREPSAPLYFSLGNLYADQGLWSQAQQAYFQSHHLDARNPDYAYNLAVSLEHLAQPRLATDFYRKAVELAGTRGAVNFDAVKAQERVSRLAARQDKQDK